MSRNPDLEAALGRVRARYKTRSHEGHPPDDEILLREIERLRAELDSRKRQQVLMYSCLESVEVGKTLDGCKNMAAVALIAVRKITADSLGVPDIS